MTLYQAVACASDATAVHKSEGNSSPLSDRIDVKAELREDEGDSMGGGEEAEQPLAPTNTSTMTAQNSRPRSLPETRLRGPTVIMPILLLNLTKWSSQS